MTKQEQITQAEREVISFQNTIKSLQERLDYKLGCLEGLHDKGRIQEIKLEYFNRTVVINTDQPELYGNVIAELEKSINQQISIFSEAIAKENIGLVEKKKEYEALVNDHEAKAKAELDAKINAEVEKRLKAKIQEEGWSQVDKELQKLKEK